jgi:2-iminobutanoate/2-iminopropanoate deaminase
VARGSPVGNSGGLGLFLEVAASSGGDRAEEDAVSATRFINPETLSKPPGYTHVVEASAPARLVYIAGQLGLDRDGKLGSDFRAQAVQTFENLKNALAAVGGEFRHVVKLNNYLVDVKDLPTFREVRDGYLPSQNRPASTTLAISALAREGALLEIEAVAVLPATRARAAGRTRGRRSAAKRARRKAR